jgi:hypothetical protein
VTGAEDDFLVEYVLFIYALNGKMSDLSLKFVVVYVRKRLLSRIWPHVVWFKFAVSFWKRSQNL